MIFDKIENAKDYYFLGKKWEYALKLIEGFKNEDFTAGKTEFENGVKFNRFEYETKPAELAKMEGHRKFADIMFMAKGEEKLLYKPADELKNILTPYNEEMEAFLAKPMGDETELTLKEGMFAVFLPQDGHTAGVMINAPKTVRRCVIKVPLD